MVVKGVDCQVKVFWSSGRQSGESGVKISGEEEKCAAKFVA
jgi:hypothetical protein